MVVLVPDVFVTKETMPVILAATILASAGGISRPHFTHEKPQNSYQLALATLMWIAATIIRPGTGNGASFVRHYSGKGIIGRH